MTLMSMPPALVMLSVKLPQLLLLMNGQSNALITLHLVSLLVIRCPCSRLVARLIRFLIGVGGMAMGTLLHLIRCVILLIRLYGLPKLGC